MLIKRFGLIRKTKEKEMIKIIFIVLTTAFVMFISDASAQQIEEKVGLKITVSTRKQCYKPTEAVKLDITILNTSASTILLYHEKGQDFIEGLRWSIVDDDNNHLLEQDTIGKRFIRNLNKAKFIRIKPRMTVKQQIEVFPREIYLKNQGDFYLLAYYESPIWFDILPPLQDREKIWTIGDKAVYSTKTKIMFTSNCGKHRKL
jgi:hypothetical protein